MAVPREPCPYRTPPLPRQPLPDPTPSLSDWRRRVLDVTLWATAALALIAYVPGVLAAHAAGLTLLVVADTIALVIALTLAGWRGLPYGLRAGGFIALCFVLALVLLVEVGPLGGGVVWLFATPVLAAVLFGLRGALLGLGLVLATGAAGVLVLHLELLGPGHLELGSRYDFASWAATLGSVLFLAGVLSLSIAYLVRSLERSLDEARASRARLEQANLELEREIIDRMSVEGQLAQSQKMEALGTLAGGIAHDFNNLLVPILMETHEVRDRLPPDSPERADLGDVIRSAERARDLVRRILTFSRGTEAERRPLEIDHVLREVVSLLRSTLPATVRLECADGAPGARVLANATELHQVLMNLGTNAYLAMQGTGGTIRLSSRLEKGNPSPPESTGDHIVLEVTDTGIGMSEEVMRRALDPFFTTRPPGKGTGLGLALAHRTVTGAGGTLGLRSVPGRGTTVTIRLPVTDREAPAPEGAGGAAPDGKPPLPAEGRARVLLVDDEEMVRRATRMILQRLGHAVEEAASPESALRRVEEDPAAFDLVLTDQAMPGMTGLAMARRIRRICADLPILVASGYLDDAALQEVEELGIEGVLEKPYDRGELVAQIRSALSGGRAGEGGAGTDAGGPLGG
jgi:signal transduction histidine kinase/CheY-like chemotaxis protein